MAVNLSPLGGVAAQFFNNDGVPLSGGLIYTYTAGTNTPANTYTTGAGNIAHSNPIVLDSAGRVPTGEIWLTDSLAYKFVIKDAQNNLIGTYDNLVGINSNFVNYTASQEIQTATAGQTVFTLTTMAYQPGTNSLSVFVDGVNQYGPGAQYAFVETSSTSVTFANGLHVGASVKFTTAVINNIGSVNASQVSYTAPFAGAETINVEAKLAQYVNVKDFGAVGDGFTNDTAAIQAAIDAVASIGGGQVFFEEGVYLITSGLTANIGVILNGQSRTDVSSNTNGGGVATARPTIYWGGSAGGYMFTIEPAVVGDCVWGGGSIDIEWNGGDAAAVGVHFNNTKYAIFDGKVRQVTFAGVLVNSQSGSVGNFSMKNHIRSLEFVWGVAVACQNANGLYFGGNGTNVPSTQQLVGDVSGLVYNGALVRIGETDNAQFQSVHGVVQTGGTGCAVDIRNVGAQPSNHNVFFYCVGPVKFDNGLTGNNFVAYNSEGGGFTQLTGTSNWVGNLMDYVTGDQYVSHAWQLRDKISIKSSDLIGESGTTAITAFALQWPCVSIGGGTDGKTACVIPAPYWISDGKITGVEVVVGSNGTSGGNYVLEVDMSTGTSSSIAVTPERVQSNIVAAGAQYTPTTYTFDFFGVPLPFAKNDHIFLKIRRDGAAVADTNTDAMMILGARILFEGTGPNSPGSGNYYIPSWS